MTTTAILLAIDNIAQLIEAVAKLVTARRQWLRRQIAFSPKWMRYAGVVVAEP